MDPEVVQILRDHCRARALVILARATGFKDPELQPGCDPDFIHVAHGLIGIHTHKDEFKGWGGPDDNADAAMRDLTAVEYEKLCAKEKRMRARTTKSAHPEAFKALMFAYLDQCLKGGSKLPWPRHFEKRAMKDAIAACVRDKDPELTALLHKELSNMTRPQRKQAREIAFEARFPVQAALKRSEKT